MEGERVQAKVVAHRPRPDGAGMRWRPQAAAGLRIRPPAGNQQATPPPPPPAQPLAHPAWLWGRPWGPPAARCWDAPGPCTHAHTHTRMSALCATHASTQALAAPLPRPPRVFPSFQLHPPLPSHPHKHKAGGSHHASRLSPTKGRKKGRRTGRLPHLMVMKKWFPRSSTEYSTSLRRGSTTRHSPSGSSALR